MKPTLREFARRLMDCASSIAVKEEVAPMYAALLPSNDLVMMRLDQLGMGPRTLKICRALTKVIGASYAAWVMEAWAADARPGESLEQAQSPSTREDRKEMIVIMATDGKRQLALSREIERCDGQPTKIGKVLGDDDESSAKMAPGRDFFDWSDITPEQEQAARLLWKIGARSMPRAN